MDLNMILIVSLLVSVLLLFAPGSVRIASGQGQMTDVKVLERGNDWQCPSMEERERARNEIHQIINSVIETTLPTTTTTASTTTMPLTTTSATTMSTTTSMSTMSTITGICDCNTCNGTQGWRRVAFINMTDTSYNCPTGLNLTSYSKRTCGASHATWGGCSSTRFGVEGLPYSRVCGRIRGYQVGSTNAFFYSSRGIDSYYVSGVSLTRGGAGNRQHIWTFAAGISEVRRSGNLDEGCPCDTAADRFIPTYVGNDYFCESGLHSEWNSNYGVLFSNDVLWDGQDCTSTSTCCQFNNPPWFTKNLPNATTDDIELRICTPNFPSNADVPLELIELYVQ